MDMLQIPNNNQSKHFGAKLGTMGNTNKETNLHIWNRSGPAMARGLRATSAEGCA